MHGYHSDTKDDEDARVREARHCWPAFRVITLSIIGIPLAEPSCAVKDGSLSKAAIIIIVVLGT